MDIQEQILAELKKINARAEKRTFNNGPHLCKMPNCLRDAHHDFNFEKCFIHGCKK